MFAVLERARVQGHGTVAKECLDLCNEQLGCQWAERGSWHDAENSSNTYIALGKEFAHLQRVLLDFTPLETFSFIATEGKAGSELSPEHRPASLHSRA